MESEKCCPHAPVKGGSNVKDYERAEASANFIRSRCDINPKIALVCGSGWQEVSNLIEKGVRIPYSEIPNFPVPTGVPGHSGNLLLGYIHDKAIICMEGRFHAYEGHPTSSCTFPIKVMKLLGVTLLINTAASGSVNPEYEPGDVMIVKDHISLPTLAIGSPLVGKNDERFGPRFPAMVKLYDEGLRQMFKRIAKEQNVEHRIREGVYVNIGGPAYETVAEVRMLRNWGADTVGMSMTHEVTVANYCGMKVFGLAIISDKAPDSYELTEHTNAEAVIKKVKEITPMVSKLLSQFFKELKV